MSLRFEILAALASGGPQTMRRLEATTKAGREAIRHHLEECDEIERVFDDDGEEARWNASIIYRLRGDERRGVDSLEEYALFYLRENYQLRRHVIAALTTGPHDRDGLEAELDQLHPATISRDHMNRVLRELCRAEIAQDCGELGFDLTRLGYALAERLWPG